MSISPFRTSRALAGAATAVGLIALYSTTRRPLMLDSPQAPSSTTLVFPKNFPFSKQLTVTKVEQVNHDTKLITFALPGGSNEISGVGPGGAILTQHTPAGRWFPVMRPYTPVHDLDQRGVLQLLVKKYPNGAASGHLHSLTPGKELTVRGPLPTYSWKPSATPRDLLLVAGGAGITPIYSLTKGILRNPDDKTRVQILWGVNGTRDIILKDELESLEKQFPGRLSVKYVVSGPEGKPEAPSLGDEARYSKGYIDKAVLQEAIKRAESTGSWGDSQGKKIFFCGPPKMQEAITGRKGVLNELGVEKKAVHVF